MLESRSFKVSGNIQFFKLEMYRLKADAYNGDILDYFLIFYEYNPQTELYLTTTVIRLKLSKSGNLVSLKDLNDPDFIYNPKETRNKVPVKLGE